MFNNYTVNKSFPGFRGLLLLAQVVVPEPHRRIQKNTNVRLTCHTVLHPIVHGLAKATQSSQNHTFPFVFLLFIQLRLFCF